MTINNGQIGFLGTK